MEEIEMWLEDQKNFKGIDRPLVTLSYAQSMDGCLTIRRGQSTPLSGPEAMRVTHLVRAAHDTILVGIGTVLADDPRLSVRLVPGISPRPVVLDTFLRIPLDRKLLQRQDKLPWIFTGNEVDLSRRDALEEKGGRVFSCAAASRGYLDLRSLMDCLWGLGVKRLMVEGGAQVITSFLNERLVDRVVVTTSPVWLGGLGTVEYPLLRTGDTGTGFLPALENPTYQRYGRDMILYGWLGEVTL
jgi:GTP cyclohydrolase II